MKHILRWICRRRLKTSLCILFSVLALLPLLTICTSTYLSDRRQIIENRDQMARMDIRHLAQELDSTVAGYEDILYQLYTDSELAAQLRELEHPESQAVARSQIRRTLRSVFWLKDAIVSITVIPAAGEPIFYDRLSTSLQTNPSLSNFPQTTRALFDDLSQTNRYRLYPSQYAAHFANNDYYLFYIGHRGLNEKDITTTDAVFLMSVDVTLLQQALRRSSFSAENAYAFVLDADGRVIYHPDKTQIGQRIDLQADGLKSFIGQNPVLTGRQLVYYRQSCSQTGWQVVSVLDCAPFTKDIDRRQALSLSIALLSFALTLAAVLFLTTQLTRAVDSTCNVIQAISDGELTARVDLQQDMSPEIRTIAAGLNRMANRIERLIETEKDAAEKVKNAEIAALEAQLNPHFLYNSLDTINWMAIEQEQYPISNVVSALGKILRYGIDRSNGIVTVADEQAWLKQYLFLHQNRLKSTLQCDVAIDDDTLPLRVHKLLLQPFVENAIVHGFSQEQPLCILCVRIFRAGELLQIEIADNGPGIPQEVLDRLSTDQADIQRSKRYHGMQNAINRLRLYYAERAMIDVQSSAEHGTHITIRIPPESEEA